MHACRKDTYCTSSHERGRVDGQARLTAFINIGWMNWCRTGALFSFSVVGHYRIIFGQISFENTCIDFALFEFGNVKKIQKLLNEGLNRDL